MRNWLLDVLVCPLCRGHISKEERRTASSEGYSWLCCMGCGAGYPVFLDRPILVPRGVEQWFSAIDQAVAWDGPPRSDTESLAWLGEQLGLGKRLKELVRWRSLPRTSYTRDEWITILEKLRGKAVSARSGEGFKGEIRKKMLEEPLAPIPVKEAPRSILDEFASQVIDSSPQRLLDIASGGGFAFTRILAHIKNLELAVSVEKSISCLWQIQYRAEYVTQTKATWRSDCRAEAVGGDARKLPFRDEFFDYVSTYHSLGEICGIQDVLWEAQRVLQKGGRLQLSFSNVELANYKADTDITELRQRAEEKTPLSAESIDYIVQHLPKLEKEAFREFLEEADLFISLGRLENQLRECGFKIKDCFLYPRDPERSRLAKEDFIIVAQKSVRSLGRNALL